MLACDDTIPYGAYTSYSEANVTAQNTLRQASIEQGWFSSHYGVDIIKQNVETFTIHIGLKSL